ncbi:alanine racemase [Aliiglaciecola sp. LCG003]|uniref:alanine racemase n=1 Tax=Aliiglaciecola sp. LCG003 TaxID=3053655 RepID=UPI0025726A71|nr:alanine racemase [Aliiglaciecola sp. LCG003]WJG11050.1 alanine racemase [Aliiglaciecola sp. LCG003]
MSRPTEIAIDLSALRHNYQVAKNLSPHSQTVAVIKADAYGHGAVEVARAIQHQVAIFAVSSEEEASELRSDGILLPILLLEGCFDAQELLSASLKGFEVVTHNHLQLQMIQSMQLPVPIKVWLKVDTGMHRLGIKPEQAVEFVAALSQSSNVSEVILMTHLSIADNLENEFTAYQLERFKRCHQSIETALGMKLKSSIANSAGLMAWPESHSEFDRPGIMLFGLSPFSYPNSIANSLKSVMSFNSKVIAVRSIKSGESVGYGNTWTAQQDSVIATVAVGYGDGYPRNARSGTPVMVNQQRARLCGRVSMDMITVDVTDLTAVSVNDDVELWGKHLSADEVASWADTIGYELVTRMPKRCRRTIAP